MKLELCNHEADEQHVIREFEMIWDVDDSGNHYVQSTKYQHLKAEGNSQEEAAELVHSQICAYLQRTHPLY